MDEIINKWSKLGYQVEYNVKSNCFVIKRFFEDELPGEIVSEILINDSGAVFEQYRLLPDFNIVPLEKSQVINLSEYGIDLIDLTREYFWKELIIDIEPGKEIPENVEVATTSDKKAKFTVKKVVKIEQLPDGSLTAVVKGYFE